MTKASRGWGVHSRPISGGPPGREALFDGVFPGFHPGLFSVLPPGFDESGGAGGHVVELGERWGQGLFCGALAGADGGVDGAPVAGDVGVFAGEVESVLDGSGEFQDGVEAAGGDVAVGAEGVGVGLPVLGGAVDELVAEVVDGGGENAGELLNGEVADLFAGALGE